MDVFNVKNTLHNKFALVISQSLCIVKMSINIIVLSLTTFFCINNPVHLFTAEELNIYKEPGIR